MKARDFAIKRPEQPVHDATAHTPTPWHLNFYCYQDDPSAPTGRRAMVLSDSEYVGGIADGCLISATGATVCDVKRRGPAMQADVYFIRDAVNSYAKLLADRAALLEALKVTVNWVEAETDDRDWPHPVLRKARAAIKQVEGS